MTLCRSSGGEGYLRRVSFSLPGRRRAPLTALAAPTFALLLLAAACSGGGDDGEAADATTTRPAYTTTTPGPTTPLVTTPNGEPQREGDFEEVASGDDGGLEWTLSRAPAAGGGVCWKLETDPELTLVREPEHCDGVLPADMPVAFRADFPYAGDIRSGADHDIVVGVIPAEIEKAEFGFADGSSAPPTYLDVASGIVVWAGSSRPVAAAVEITLADGTPLGCGPGDVTSALELYEAPEAKLLDIRQFVWTCLEIV